MFASERSFVVRVESATLSELNFSRLISAALARPSSLRVKTDERSVRGAIRQLVPGVTEVKRIFVEPEAWQLGIGRKILSVLETIGRDLGYNALQLETGVRQPAAIRLYEKAGYQRIPAYGRYRDDPLSVCFEKVVGKYRRAK